MKYLKKFNTDTERQACTDEYIYVSYINDTDKINLHDESDNFLCKLTLDNGNIIEIEGRGELTSAMTSQYSATTVSAEIGKLCTEISNSTFKNFSSLTSVDLGENVENIGIAAFNYCTALTNLTIPYNVLSINTGAFSDCYNLKNITITNSNTNFSFLSFANCSGLESITSLATTAPTIRDNTFQNIKENGTLYVPQGSTGYNTWMQHLSYYNWTKVEQ